MREGISEFQSSFDAAVSAAVRIGRAAGTAKALVPHGQFMQWLADNVKTMSGTWIRVCMRAAQSYDLLATRADRDAIIAQAGTVEKVAALLPLLDDDGSFKADPPPPRTRAPNKAKAVPKLVIDRSRDAGKDEAIDVPSRMVAAPAVASGGTSPARDDVDTGKGANEAAEMAKWEARLVSWEARLAAREKALDAREVALKMREAAPEAGAFGLKPDESVDQIKEKALARAAKKAAPAPTAATGSVAKEEGKGKVAKKEKTAPVQPAPVADVSRETVPAATAAEPDDDTPM
jgi:hypothetical protein